VASSKFSEIAFKSTPPTVEIASSRDAVFIISTGNFLMFLVNDFAFK
jgi:hypothetical protein